MLGKLQKHKGGQDGFTIIEVLIVLAIAGLIMVVVFLAVPALQRSSRNNALNTDANNILTQVGSFSSDNNGTLPTGATLTAGSSVSITGAAGSNPETAKVDSGVSAVAVNSATPLAATTTNTGAVEVVTGTNAVCNSTDSGLGAAGTASPRAYVILYVAESGSGNITKCVGN